MSEKWDRVRAVATLAMFPSSRTAVAGAIAAEEVQSYGAALGLSPADVGEVVAGYVAWHREHLCALAWPEVRAALSRRANGMEWRPEKSGETVMREAAERARIAAGEPYADVNARVDYAVRRRYP